MRAHLIANGKVVNTIEVTSLDFMPNLIDGTDGGIGWAYANGVLSAPVRDVQAEIVTFIKQVDSDADAVIAAVIGNRGGEYELAEKEALAYAAAGYPASPVPGTVLSEAIPKGLTNTQAATNILNQATAWREAQLDLRDARIARKFEASNAANGAELDAIKTTWASFLVALKAQLGV